MLVHISFSEPVGSAQAAALPTAPPAASDFDVSLSGEGATVLAVPVGHAARITGQSKYQTLDRLLVGISDILGVMWLIRRSPKNLKVKE